VFCGGGRYPVNAPHSGMPPGEGLPSAMVDETIAEIEELQSWQQMRRGPQLLFSKFVHQ